MWVDGWPQKQTGFIWARGDRSLHVLVLGIRPVADTWAFVEGMVQGYEGRKVIFVEKRDVRPLVRSGRCA